MPIDLHSSIKGMSQWAYGSNLLNNTLGSSIPVALIITLFMVLLIMCIYPAKSGTPFSVLAKLFVYMFFGTLLLIFLHDGVVRYMVEEQMTQKDNEFFMQNTTMQGRDPAYSDLYKKVLPGPVVAPVAEPVVAPVTDSVSGGGSLYGVKPNKASRNPYS